MTDNELKVLYQSIARDLADTLMVWARDRRDDEKKLIGQLQRDLCKLRRAELADPPDEETS